MRATWRDFGRDLARSGAISGALFARFLAIELARFLARFLARCLPRFSRDFWRDQWRDFVVVSRCFPGALGGAFGGAFRRIQRSLWSQFRYCNGPRRGPFGSPRTAWPVASLVQTPGAKILWRGRNEVTIRLPPHQFRTFLGALGHIFWTPARVERGSGVCTSEATGHSEHS